MGKMVRLWTVTYDQASRSSAQLFIPHRHEYQTPWKDLQKPTKTERVHNILLSAAPQELVRISCARLYK